MSGTCFLQAGQCLETVSCRLANFWNLFPAGWPMSEICFLQAGQRYGGAFGGSRHLSAAVIPPLLGGHGEPGAVVPERSSAAAGWDPGSCHPLRGWCVPGTKLDCLTFGIEVLQGMI